MHRVVYPLLPCKVSDLAKYIPHTNPKATARCKSKVVNRGTKLGETQEQRARMKKRRTSMSVMTTRIRNT